MTYENDSGGAAYIAERMRPNQLTDMEALTEFLVNNAELEQLEERLRQFNIFEAVGMHWQEIRHSAFLAFLLDPRQPHGLGDDFLKKVLQRALLGKGATNLPINAIHLHLMTLEDTTAHREQNSIDILLLNERHQLAVIIENKLQTGEHDDQLARYYETVAHQHPGWCILGLYLTLTGAKPSDSRYLPISYADIADITQTLVVSRESVLGPDVRTLMSHYVQMLRRNIVSDAEIDNLCRQIYQKHQRAIDLIIAHRPNKQAMIQEELNTMMGATPGIRLRYVAKQQIGFHPMEWDVPVLQQGAGHNAPALMLEFYIYNNDYSIKIVLFAQWGPEEHRQKLLNMALANRDTFRARIQTLNKTANSIYSRTLISQQSLQSLDMSSLITELHKQWASFVDTDLERIKEFVQAEKWVWTENYVPDSDETGNIDELAAPIENIPDES